MIGARTDKRKEVVLAAGYRVPHNPGPTCRAIVRPVAGVMERPAGGAGLMGWQISANLGRTVRAGADARGWRWEISRGAEVAQVVIEISGKAWSADPLSLPEDTRHALETDGRTELLKVLDQDNPPCVIRCGSSGCTYLSASEAGEWPTRT